MSVSTIGKRPVSLDQIALVERFDPSSNPNFKPGRLQGTLVAQS
jgi:hypothetical protein